MTPPIRPEADPLARLRAKRQAAEAATQQTAPAAPPKPGYQADPDLSRATFGQRGANFIDGLTFGFGDELAAASGYAVGKLTQPLTGNAPDFQKLLQQARTLRAEGQRQRPVESLGLQVAGGVAQGAGLAGALKAGGAPLAARVLNPSTYRGLAALGAAEGALAGAGSADGTLSDRATGAVVGGVAGGIASPALVAGGRLLGRAGGYAVDALNLRAPARQAGEQAPTGRLAGLLKNRTGAVGNGVPQEGNFLMGNTAGEPTPVAFNAFGHELYVTNSVQRRGKTQATIMSADGRPLGHFEGATPDDALRSARQAGFVFQQRPAFGADKEPLLAQLDEMEGVRMGGDEWTPAMQAEYDAVLRQLQGGASPGNRTGAVGNGVPQRGNFLAPSGDDVLDVAASRRLGRLISTTGRDIGPDDMVTVYHRTTPENAERLLQQGVQPGAKPSRPPTVIQDESVARMLGKNVGDALDYEPGRGQGSGFYVGANPAALTQYGDALLAARVRAGDLLVPPERARTRLTPTAALLLDDGYTEAAIPASAIRRVAMGGGNRTGAVNPAVVNTVGGAGAGALLGAATDDEHRTRGATFGAIGGATLGATLSSQLARRAAGGAARRAADDAVPSTTPPATGLRALLQQVGVAPIEDRADDLVLRAARDARVDLGAAAEKVRRGTGEMPEAVMDVLGERGVQMGAALKTLPSGAKNTLKQTLSARIASTGEDVGRLFGQESGLSRRNLVTTVEDLVQQQKANARPLYETAYATAPVDDPAILSAIAGEPRFRQALKVGARIARTEGTPLPADVLEAFTTGGVQGQSLRALPVQAIDLMKRGLDDVIERGMKGGKMGRTEARALRNKLRDVLAQVDAIRPEYAAARAQYAGDAAITEAAELGRDVLNPGKTDALLNAVQRMSDSEREAFRLTAGEQIARMTDGEGSVAQLLKKSSKLRGLFEVVFPDEGAAERFAVKANRRQQLGNNAREVLQNSRTAERQAGQDEIAGAAQAVRGGLRGIADRVVDSQLAQAAQGRNAALAEALAQRLLAGAEGGTQGRDALAAQLQRLAAVEAKRRAAVPVKAVAARSAATRQGATAVSGQTGGRRP